MKLKTLSVFTGALLVASLFVYSNENKRGTDLLSGSDYVKGLDLNKIQKISLSFNKSEKLTLTRDSDQFVLENHKSYPAKTDVVNDLIYKIASIQVKEKVTSVDGEDDLKKYGLDKNKRKYLIELFDNNDNKTISIRVGNAYKGKGNYLYKEGGEDVYLSQKTLWLNSSYKDFINTVLLEANDADIEMVTLKTDKTLEIARGDEGFSVLSPKNSKYKKDKVQEYVKNFSSISFDEYYSLTEPRVQGLHFDKDIKIKLKNKLIYKISLAKDNEDHFVKLSALLDEVSNKFVVKKDDGKEELQKIEDVIKAQADAQKFNIGRGAWVYKIDKSIYEKLAKKSNFFM